MDVGALGRAERRKKTEEMIAELTPILREVMGTATERLDELDKKGYFAFGRELVRVLNMSARLATLWAQVEPTTHETSPGPRVPEPGAPPIMPPEVDAEAFAQAEGEALSRLVDGLFLGRCEASADVNRCAFDARMPGGLV